MPTSTDKDSLRTLVRSAYDLQKLRIQMGNRICENFRNKLGLKPSSKEESDDEAKTLLDDLRSRYKKLTDGVVRFPRRATFKGDGVITAYTELTLLSEYVELEASEARQFRRLTGTLEDFPIYNNFLSEVRGCGPILSGVIIAEIDIAKARYPSSVWAYAGYDVAGDGKGRSRRKEHLIQRAYTNKNGEEAERASITFNPFLKTKLYMLGTCFVRSGGPYRKIYDDYKHRLESSPRWAEATKAHRHDAAIRYAIKRFLVDLYKAWRPLEGLDVAPEYSVAKLGIVHSRVS